MKEKILELLKEIHPQHDFESSSDFIADEIFDSFDMIDLIDSIESTFHCKINGLDILPENFCNLEEIEKTVKKNGGIL